MSEPSTYIKLDRNILVWGWYQDSNTMRLFIHLLLKANIKDKEWMGQMIHRGELATSYVHLSKELKMSVQNVRTALEHLKSTHEVTLNSHNKYSIITISNYDKYQLDNTQANTQLTNNQHSTNIQLTTTKEYKNIRIKEEKNIYGEFQNVKLTDKELAKLKELFPTSWNDKIENLSAYLDSKGDKYKNHYSTILNWARRDKENGTTQVLNRQDERTGDLQYGIVF